MKKLIAVAAVAAALTLAGCSAAPAADHAAAKVAETSSSAPVLTAAPTADPVEVEFLAATNRIPGLENVPMKDALKVGHYVCAQLDAGASPLNITAVKNTAKVNNEDMIMVSTLTLCKGHNDSVQKIISAEHVKEAQAQR